jgi:hypothetical protein
MRAAALTLLCVVAFGYAMHAQRFSLLPQVGFENSKTNISYNNGSSFSPLGVKFTPQASLRLNYASKQGHGFFVGAATNRSLVTYSFANPETGMTDYVANTGNMQVKLEGGYQFNTKPISLGKKKSSGSQAKTATKSTSTSSTTKSHCGKTYTYSRCGSSKKTAAPAQAKSKGSWMRIQPSIGMAYIPAVKNDISSETQNGQTMYEYKAGNWQTGLIAGTSFEFGKNKTRLFTVSVNYFKGIGNLDQQTMTTSEGAKTVTTTLKSDVSGWNMRIGIPFTLGGAKKSPAKKTTEHKSPCQQYKIRYRCSGS